MDVARRILLAVEEAPPRKGPNMMFKLEGVDEEIVWYHTRLLNEAGLLDAQEASSMGTGGPEWYPEQLTWRGHMFLEEARENTRWQAAKTFVMSKGGALTLKALETAFSIMTSKALGGE